MTKLNRGAVVAEALAMLDEVGIDAISTRKLAQRLNIEQPALYWHFKNKAELLTAMAEAAMEPHATQPLPSLSDNWEVWFIENMRSFRNTLLSRRDGARLHAGTRPKGEDVERIAQKIRFLVSSGIPEEHARMALFAAGRLTVGCVLEEQSDIKNIEEKGHSLVDHEAAFEIGSSLLIKGLDSLIVF